MPSETPTRHDLLNPPVPDGATARVREAWARALGHDDFGDDEDFFLVVGGHSLLVAAIMAELSAAVGRRLSLRLFFDHPTVRELAGALGADLAAEVPSA